MAKLHPGMDGHLMHMNLNNSGSKNPHLQGLDQLSIDDYFNTTMAIINSVYTNIKTQYINAEHQNDYQYTEDYKKYGFIPGQRFARAWSAAPPFLHHAIYIGNGLIFELSPISENIYNRNGLQISVGLSDLNEWFQKAVDKQVNVILINNTKLDINNKDEMNELFNRIRNFMNKSKGRAYQLFTFKNCESIINLLTTGDNITYQGQLINRSISAVVLLKYLLSRYDDCKEMQLTVNGSVCTEDSNNLYNQWVTKQCTVDPRTEITKLRLETHVRNSDNSLNQWRQEDFYEPIQDFNIRSGIVGNKRKMKIVDNKWKSC